jgi:nitroreductase
MDRTANTFSDLHPLLAQRWSPRGFDPEHQVSDTQLTAVLEAARWAPSAANTQPWRFVVARRGSAEFQTVYDALMPGNQAWAGAASVLLVAAAQTRTPEGDARPWAQYDTGQAVAHLSVQAQHEGLVVHQMGGFDADRLAAELRLPGEVRPLVVVALGRHDPSAQLAEPFASRERAVRERLPLEALLLHAAPASSGSQHRAA